jgi:hypothetical protein
LNDPTPFLHFCNYLPFEEDLALNLNKFIPFIQGYFVPSLTEIDLPAGFGEEAFLFLFSVYFYSFAFISPWRKGLPFI